MIATIIFFVFFLVIYLTRPNRKRRQSRSIKLRKPELKSRLEQARQQAIANFWVQALVQTSTNTKETRLASETTAIEEPELAEQVQVPIIPQPETFIIAEPQLEEQVQVPTISQSETVVVTEPGLPEHVQAPIIPKPETVIVTEPELTEQVQAPIVPQPETVNDVETELPEHVRASDLQQEEPTKVTDTKLSEKIILPLQTAAQTESAKASEAYSAFVNYLKDFAAKNVDITTQAFKPVPVQPSAPEQDVIDINPEVQPIAYEKLPDELVKYEPGIPHWDHHYVYQLSEINYANPNQQAFYQYFKKAFLNGIYLNLDGNTNYAFVLYFDLIKSYSTHLDLELLEKQFRSLEKICVRIWPYAKTYLVGKMREFGDYQGVDRIQEYWTSPGYHRPDYLDWDWRNRFKKKMNLSEEDVKMLEPLSLSANNFLNIEFCCINALRVYLALVKTLQKKYTELGTTMTDEFKVILDIIARKQNRYHLNSPNYNYTTSHEAPLFQYLFRYGESALREHYRHARKVQVEGYFTHPEVKTIIAEKINTYLDSEIPGILKQLDAPDGPIELELNNINTARWRNFIDQAIQSYRDKDSGPLEILVRLNEKNSSRDLLLYEISRQLCPLNKSEALIYIFRHVTGAKKEQKAYKLPTASMNKQLFKKPEESERFYAFLNEYIKHPDAEKATEFAKAFYQSIRKKISLDTQAIQQAEAKDNRTAERLSAYLKDEDEIVTNPIKKEIANMVQPEAQLLPTPPLNIPLPSGAFTLLETFKEQNFELSSTEAENHCKPLGLMAANLINSINEACFDLLDENLIEKIGSTYQIQPDYYYQIINA